MALRSFLQQERKAKQEINTSAIILRIEIKNAFNFIMI